MWCRKETFYEGLAQVGESDNARRVLSAFRKARMRQRQWMVARPLSCTNAHTARGPAKLHDDDGGVHARRAKRRTSFSQWRRRKTHIDRAPPFAVSKRLSSVTSGSFTFALPLLPA